MEEEEIRRWFEAGIGGGRAGERHGYEKVTVEGLWWIGGKKERKKGRKGRGRAHLRRSLKRESLWIFCCSFQLLSPTHDLAQSHLSRLRVSFFPLLEYTSSHADAGCFSALSDRPSFVELRALLLPSFETASSTELYIVSRLFHLLRCWDVEINRT